MANNNKNYSCGAGKLDVWEGHLLLAYRLECRFSLAAFVYIRQERISLR